MIELIIIVIIIVGIISIVIGVLLGLAEKFLIIKEDPNVELIYNLLPHFNCGACGFPGCSGMANALANNETDVSNCKPSKPEQKDEINALLTELGIINQI